MRKFSAAMLAVAISFSGAEASASVHDTVIKSDLGAGLSKDWLEAPPLHHVMAFAPNLDEPELQTGAPRLHLALFGVCISSRGGAFIVC